MIPRPMRLTVVALTLSAFVAVPGAVADIILSGTIDSGTTVTVPVGEAGTMDGSLVNNGTIDVGGAGTALYSPPLGQCRQRPMDFDRDRLGQRPRRGGLLP